MKKPEEIKRMLVTCLELNMPPDVQHMAMKDALAYIQQLEAQVPRWIPVEERLPEKYEHVLVATRFSDEGEQDFEIAYYAYERWRKPEGYLYGRVTHWMPLPEPPKEDAQ